jgi:hypothetical protein
MKVTRSLMKAGNRARCDRVGLGDVNHPELKTKTFL